MVCRLALSVFPWVDPLGSNGTNQLTRSGGNSLLQCHSTVFVVTLIEDVPMCGRHSLYEKQRLEELAGTWTSFFFFFYALTRIVAAKINPGPPFALELI